MQYKNTKKVEKSYLSTKTTFVPKMMHQDKIDLAKVYILGEQAEIIKFDKNTLKVDWILNFGNKDLKFKNIESFV